jgi:hypothetical protein
MSGAAAFAEGSGNAVGGRGADAESRLLSASLRRLGGALEWRNDQKRGGEVSLRVIALGQMDYPRA